MASLLEDLRKVGAALNPSELPTGVEVGNVLGSLLKALEHAGVTVAEELLPKPVDAVVEPIVAAAEPVLRAEQDKLIAELQAKIDALEGKAGPTPPVTVATGSGFGSSITPPAGSGSSTTSQP